MPWHQRFIDEVLAIFSKQQATLLELGCGRGELARVLLRKKKQWSIIGIDSDLCGMAETQQEHGARLNIEIMDAANLGFADNSFEYVYSLNTFEHIGSLKETYREIYRVLKPGGMVYVAASPIWTSYRGNHFYHWDLDRRDIILPWEHIYPGRDSLLSRLQSSNPELREEIDQYVFKSDYLNRVPISKHFDSILDSGLSIRSISTECKFEISKIPSADYIRHISAKTGIPVTELLVDYYSVVLEKP